MQSKHLLEFNCHLLDQAINLAAAHGSQVAPGFSVTVGPHLRHLIEHYEQFLGIDEGALDYDRRLRDPMLERSPQAARERLIGIRNALTTWHGFAPDTPVRVRGVCGAGGENRFEVTSTLGRELAFLAGHVVHHFALLKSHCDEHAIAVADGFGKAPATVAYEKMISRFANNLKGKIAS